MSMNAHINRDFPYLVEALGMIKPDGSTRKVDHDRGNRVLHPLYDDVLRELSARYDSSISNYDVPGLFADDVALFQILQGWREGVWRNAEMLRNAKTPAQRKVALGLHRELRAEPGAADPGQHHDQVQRCPRRPVRRVPAHAPRAGRPRGADRGPGPEGLAAGLRARAGALRERDPRLPRLVPPGRPPRQGDRPRPPVRPGPGHLAHLPPAAGPKNRRVLRRRGAASGAWPWRARARPGARCESRRATRIRRR